MKIRIVKNLIDYKFDVKFIITEITDEEILRITKLSPVFIDLSPEKNGISNDELFQIFVGDKGSSIRNFKLMRNNEGILNLDDFFQISIMFYDSNSADIYSKNIVNQFHTELKRLENLDQSIVKDMEYEISTVEGIKKIYDGAEKLLDTNSKEYKEIIEKNKEAWKKLADL